MAIVSVLVYEPASVFAGTATCIVGVTVNPPIPEEAAALNSFTAVGGTLPAGTPRGYVMAFVGFVQVTLALQADVTPVMLDADVERVLPPPAENCVDVIVMFQPAPEPVASTTDSGIPNDVV